MDNSWWGPIDPVAARFNPPRPTVRPTSELLRRKQEGGWRFAHDGYGDVRKIYGPFEDELAQNVMRPQDAFRFDAELRPTEYVCKVHWGHLENGKPKYPRLHPAVAIWNGRWYLCEDALNHWLDNADEDPSLEPERLVFL